MKSLYTKIGITLLFLALYKFFSYISIPTINPEVIKDIFAQTDNNLLKMANMFSGDAVSKLSIISLGILPYISATIIMELFSYTYEPLKEMKKSKEGLVYYVRYIKMLTFVIAVVQSIGVTMSLTAMGNEAMITDKENFFLISVVSLVTGSMILVWIAEQINKVGIGSGVSLIIFTGIVSGFPGGVKNIIDVLNGGTINFLNVIGIVAVLLITVSIILYVELSERRIKISYMDSSSNMGMGLNYIPLKINMAGIMPPIFAMALLAIPQTMLQGNSDSEVIKFISDLFNINSISYNIIVFILVVFFAFFYTSMIFNAKEISDNLRKQNSFIDGIRQGGETEEFLKRVVNKITIVGALYLGLITTIPWLLLNALGIPFFIGGTIILIVVQVAISTTQLIMTEYSNLNFKNNINIVKI